MLEILKHMVVKVLIEGLLSRDANLPEHLKPEIFLRNFQLTLSVIHSEEKVFHLKFKKYSYFH